MPLTRALRTFKGRYGLIRAGTVFNCEPGYFAALEKQGFVKVETERTPPGPGENRAIPAAPETAAAGAGGEKRGVVDPGKAPAADQGGDTSQNPVILPRARGRKATDPRRGGGKPLTSRSLRQDLPSAPRTSSESESGDAKPRDPDQPEK